MTVPVPSYTEKTWQGDGSTVAYSFQTRVDEAADIKVWFIENDVETLKSLTTHYTLTGLGNPAGVTVTMLAAATAMQKVKARRDTVPKQNVNYTDLGKVPGDTTEGLLDRLAMALQDVKNRADLLESISDIGGLIEDFDKRYLGAFGANPATDNGGIALLTGAIYFNTVVGKFRVWTGATWQDQTVALNNGDVTYAKIEPVLSDHIYRTLAAEDLPFFVDPVSGSETGTGSDSSPFLTLNRARDALPALTGKWKTSVNLVAGNHSTGSGSGDERQAMFFLDGRVQVGRRSDTPGGNATGGLVVRGLGTLPGDTVVQHGGSYPYGFYITGGAGSVAIEKLQTRGASGAQAAIVSHRDCYVHLNRVESDGDGFTSIGWEGEANGRLEAIDSNVWDCTINVLAYDLSFVAVSNSSIIGASGTYGAQSAGGLISINGAVSVLSKIISTGGKVSITGNGSNRPIIDAAVEVRDSVFLATLADFKNVILQHGGNSDLVQCGWSSQYTQNGGHVRMAACKSYLSPDLQSLASVPWAILSGTHTVDAFTEIINNAGQIVSPSYLPQLITLTGNSQPVPVTITDKVSTMKLSGGAADRTGCYLDTVAGRFAGTRPSDGQLLVIVGVGAGVQLISYSAGTIGSTIPGGSVNIGSATGKYSGWSAMYNNAENRWREAGIGRVY
jgi:hypothetical protein